MRNIVLSSAMIAAMVAPAQAQTFKAENGVKVEPAGNGFLVTGDAGLGARGIWCAAADYARSNGGARDAQRLYIAKGRKAGLGQRGPVAFTLDPSGLTPSSVLILGTSIAKAGANLSVGHAYSFCADGKLTSGRG
jgi:hypothetical protein